MDRGSSATGCRRVELSEARALVFASSLSKQRSMRLLLILAVVFWTGQLHVAAHAAEEPATLCEVCVVAETAEQAGPTDAVLPTRVVKPPLYAVPVLDAQVPPAPARAPPPRGPPLSI